MRGYENTLTLAKLLVIVRVVWTKSADSFNNLHMRASAVSATRQACASLAPLDTFLDYKQKLILHWHELVILS